MAKFKVEINASDCVELRVTGGFDSQENFDEFLESEYDGDVEKYIEDGPDYWYFANFKERSDFENDSSFSLKVTDEQGDIVYETHDPLSIARYPLEDEDGFEIEEIPNYKEEKLAEGAYFVQKFNKEGCCFTVYDLEVDEFDPSKLSFYPTEYPLWSLVDEDCVSLGDIRYDNKRLDVEGDYLGWLEPDGWHVVETVTDTDGDVLFKDAVVDLLYYDS